MPSSARRQPPRQRQRGQKDRPFDHHPEVSAALNSRRRSGANALVRREPAEDPITVGNDSEDPRFKRRGAQRPGHAQSDFSLGPSTAHSLFVKNKRGSRRAPRGGERRSKGAGVVFAVRRKRSIADFATTRRMPSDASAALWQAELETLE